jgi:hypothetical protein
VIPNIPIPLHSDTLGRHRGYRYREFILYHRKERPLETYGPPRVSPLLIRSFTSSQPRGYTRRSSLQSTTSDSLSKQTAYNVRPMIHPRFDVHVAVFMELASTVGLQRRYLPEQAIARLSTHYTAEVMLHKGRRIAKTRHPVL